jgi:hypothetical protein
MTMYVYDTAGAPRGFLFETTIYALDGAPLGRVIGSRVHRFDGSYVAEWFHQMVVERSTARPRHIPPVRVPERRAPVPAASARRAVADYRNFPDAFALLVETYGDDIPVAAE